jgi:hypothetical protein
MAERAWGVSVAEPHPGFRQRIDIGSRDLGIRVIAAGISVAHIIREDDQDIWQVAGFVRQAEMRGPKHRVRDDESRN